MKITIIDPHKLLTGFGKAWNIHRWLIELIKETKPYFYISNKSHLAYLPVFLKRTGLSYSDFKILFSIKTVYSRSDLLFYPWGLPSEKNRETIQNVLRQYNGFKIVHMQDFWFQAQNASRFLLNSGVDYIAGYSRHDKDTPFFQKFFPEFVGRVISLPFGYAEDLWFTQTDIIDRKEKVLGAGAIETIHYIKSSGAYDHIREYMDYFKEGFTSMHPVRFELNNNIDKYESFIKNNFNIKGTPYQFVEDMNGYMNRFQLFINDQSLVSFPPAKTYEGCAAGAIMVAEEVDCFKRLGFRDDKNCILFPEGDFNVMKEKIVRFFSLSDKQKKDFQKSSLDLIAKYQHDRVASRFVDDLKSILKQ